MYLHAVFVTPIIDQSCIFNHYAKELGIARKHCYNTLHYAVARVYRLCCNQYSFTALFFRD